MTIYRVKVVEKHSDFIWIEADSKEEAEEIAISEAQCEFECVYSSEWTGEKED